MSTHFDPRANYENTKNQAGYVDRKKPHKPTTTA